MPNLTPIPVGTDPSQATAMMNRNFTALNNEQITKLYNDANGTPSILLGLDSNGNSVIKVAKTGIDVTTATDAQLAFNSAQNTLKVVATGTATLPAVSLTTAANSYGQTQSSVVVTHSLGYIPAILAYDSGGGSNSAVPYDTLLFFTASAYGRGGITYTVDTSTVTFYLNVFGYNATSSFGLGSKTIKYYLLQETAA